MEAWKETNQKIEKTNKRTNSKNIYEKKKTIKHMKAQVKDRRKIEGKVDTPLTP